MLDNTEVLMAFSCALLLLVLLQVGQTGTELQSLLERPPLVRANSIQVKWLFNFYKLSFHSVFNPPLWLPVAISLPSL
jgi:hypothetical protein